MAEGFFFLADDKEACKAFQRSEEKQTQPDNAFCFSKEILSFT